MDITTLTPSAGRLLIRVIEQPESDQTGLVMLNGDMQNYLMGEVVFTPVTTQYYIGTKVLMLKYGLDEVVVAGEKLCLIETINVIATFE